MWLNLDSYSLIPIRNNGLCQTGQPKGDELRQFDPAKELKGFTKY